VLLDGEERRPEAVLVVTGPAIGNPQATAVGVSMAVGTLPKPQTTISSLHWQFRRVTALAGHRPMHALERKVGERVRAQSDLLRQLEPANAGMAVLTSISKLRFMHLRMTSHALGAHAGRHDIALVVTCLALGLRMAGGEAQAGMIRPNVGNLAPVVLVVTRSAFLPCKDSLMGIFVTGRALGLQSEKRSVPAPVAAIVAVGASRRLVSTLERPSRLAVVESLPSAAGPPDQSRVSSEMLDVASAAVLAAILAPVETRLLPYPGAQVIVASEASIRVDPFARRVTFAAIRIAIDVGVAGSKFSGRQKLGAGRTRHQGSGQRRHYHQAADEHQSGEATPHSEKIQRYP